MAIAWKADRRANIFNNIVPARASGALVSISEVGDIMLIAVYGYDGNLAETKTMMRSVTQFLSTIRKPFVIGGDFNASPEAITSVLHELNFPATVMAPTGTTCQSPQYASCIDFFVVHPKIFVMCNERPSCTLTGVISPHDPVKLVLHLPGPQNQGLFLDRPRKPPQATHVFGPQLSIENRTKSLLDRSRSFAQSVGALSEDSTTRPPDEPERKICLELWSAWCISAQTEISSATGHMAQIPVAIATRTLPLSSVFASKNSQRPVPSQACRWLYDRTCELIALVKLPRARETPIQRAHRVRIMASAKGVFTPRSLAKFFHNLASIAHGPDNAHSIAATETLTIVQAIFRKHTRRGFEPPTADDLHKLSMCQGTLRGLIDQLVSSEWGISKKDYATFRDQALLGGAKVAHQITKLSAKTPDVGTRPNFVEEVAIEETK